jgi:hypothetical protein
MIKKIKNLIVVSDTHCGCQLGLCPNQVILDGGGIYNSSKFQREVYDKWEEFWNNWVPHVTKGEPYYIIHNADAIDGSHHGSTTQISQNINDQRKIFVQVMTPILNMKNCAGYYQLRGTEVHVGKSGCDEEAIAKDLDAKPDENGNYARWELWLHFGNNRNLVHFTHHVGTTSSASYESTAVYKELVEAYNEAGRWGEQPPDCVVRSHRHRQMEIRIPTRNGYGISLVTPAWQLKTPFTYRVGIGRSSTPQIGGYLIREGDEDSLFTRFKIWKLARTKTEEI